MARAARPRTILRDFDHSRAGRRLRRAALACLVLVLAIAAFCFLWPNGTVIRRILIRMWLWTTPTPGLRDLIGPEDVEQSMNLLTFIPIVGLMALALPRVRTPLWWLVSLLGGCGIETTQFLFLHGRHFDPVDALFNTIGGILGSLAALGLRMVLARWHDRRQDGASADEQEGRTPWARPS